MSVRLIAENFTRGYGVYGDVYTNDGLVKRFDLLQIVNEVPKPLYDGDEDNPVIISIRQFRWRFSIRMLSIKDEQISSIYTPLGTRKLGRYTVSALDYVTHEAFVSHNVFMSPRFTFHAKYVDYELDIDPPSSEPQVSLPSFTYNQDNLLFPWSGFYGTFPNFFDEVGSSFKVSLDPAVQVYQLGITYDFQTDIYPQSRLDDIAGFVSSYIM